jgi:hypothetical protein
VPNFPDGVYFEVWEDDFGFDGDDKVADMWSISPSSGHNFFIPRAGINYTYFGRTAEDNQNTASIRISYNVE